MSFTFFGITFASAHHFYYGFLVIIAALCIALAGYWRFSGVRTLASASRRTFLFARFSVLKLVIKKLLILCGVASLFVAFLQPQWGVVEETIEQEGRDLFIALDVSRSMLAQDKQPNRLAFAKQKIKQLVTQLKSERIGLVLFSGSAVVQCPLTVDYGAFFLFLDQIDAETISSGTTALDQAIRRVVEMFARAPARKNKLVVLLTDGEDFSSNLTQVREQAKNLGVHIFTLGIGTPQGAPVPIIDQEGRQQGHEKNEKGEIVISRLNEGILQALADESNGIYLHATDDESDVKKLATMVENYEREKFEDKKIGTLQERYPLAAFCSFSCFLIEWLL